MPDSITIPQHDRRPALRSELRDGTGAAVELAGTDTVYFLMRPVTDLTSPLRVAATVVTVGNAGSNVPAVVEWEPAASGAPAAWGSVGNHMTGKVGVYDQEWEVQDSGGKPMTLPTDLPNTVTIRDDVDYP